MSFWSEAAAGASLVNSIQMAPLKRESAQLELKRQKLGMAKAETEAEAWKGIQTEQKRQAAELKSTKGRMFATDAVTYMGATDPEKRDLNVINNDLKDTGVTAAIGKPDGWSVRTVTRSTDGKRTSDEEAVAGKLYEMLGETASEYNEEEMDEVVSSVIKSGYFLMGSDNEVVDLNEFYQTSGAYKYATGEQRSMISATDENMKNELQAVMDKKENRVKIDKKNRETQQEIKLLEDKQYQTNLSLLGKLKTGKTSSTPSPTDIIVSRYQSSEQTDEDFTAMTNDLRLLKFEKAGGGAADSSNPKSEITALKSEIDKYKKDGTPIPQVLQDEYDYKSDLYAKEFYGTGGAKDAAAIRKHQSDMTPTEVEDDNTYRSVSNQTGLIKKWDRANDQYDVAKLAHTTRNKVFDVIEKANLDWNAISKAKNEVQLHLGKLFSEDTTDIEKAKAHQYISATLGAFMADYIKSISGAAASDQEREFLTNVVFGGAWKTRDALESSMNAFVDAKSSSAKALYTEYGTQVKPNKSKERVDRMATWTNRKLKNVRDKKSKPEGAAFYGAKSGLWYDKEGKRL